MEFEFHYPEGLLEDQETGYLSNLTDEQAQALAQLKRWYNNEGLVWEELNPYGLNEDHTLLRFLRARKFNLEATQTLINQNLDFRRENQVDEILKRDPEEILGCNFDELMACYPHWCYGHDKVGRPVMFKHYGKFETWNIKKSTTLEDVLTYHIWEQETVMRMMGDATRRNGGEVVDEMIIVVDIEEMTLVQITRDFLRFGLID